MLIVDSGSTKTAIRLLRDGKVCGEFTCDGINPLLHDEDYITGVFPRVEASSIHHIFYFGAGCSTTERKDKVSRALSKLYPFASIVVESDLMAAAHAVYHGTPVSVCILGTGSNAALYDGKTLLTPTPSLGYILGDEGSGADLGKVLLRDYLYGNLPADMHKAVAKATNNLVPEEIINTVYQSDSPSRHLASLAPILSEFKQTEYTQRILNERFTAFADAFLRHHNQCDAAAVGSIAFYFKDELKKAFQQRCVTLVDVQKNPIDGLIGFYSTFVS